jgi:protoheme IX farnesyltransferase
MRVLQMPFFSRSTAREFYRLTKPGIIYGNDIAVIAGFLLASRWHVDVPLLLATLIGISCIMASGCVFNNYIDRDIDKLMDRTKRRALVEGRISTSSALVFGVLLCVIGAAALGLFVNILSLGVALFGFVFYVFFYSLWSKRYSVHSTVIGALSGAVPPVVGYTAVTGTLDMAAGILFLILAIWQLPHAFAIAIYRLKDYTAASIPVLPVAHGTRAAKIALIASVVAYALACLLLWTAGYVGSAYAVVMAAISAVWVVISFRGMHATDDVAWGRQMFRFSLIALLTFSVMISVDPR